MHDVDNLTTISFADKNQVKFAFKNNNGGTIETPWKHAGSPGARKIVIWGTTASRFVDAVRVYSLSGAHPENCSCMDMSNFDIVIPCLIVNGVKLRLRLNYDPNISGGIYWKLDESFLEIAKQ
ncbi:MAG: hypothetical protein R6U27_08925 [Desulfobacterales bacterium]